MNIDTAGQIATAVIFVAVVVWTCVSWRRFFGYPPKSAPHARNAEGSKHAA